MERLQVAQELYKRSFKLMDKRWTSIMLPVYNMLLKGIDRKSTRIEIREFIEKNTFK